MQTKYTATHWSVGNVERPNNMEELRDAIEVISSRLNQIYTISESMCQSLLGRDNNLFPLAEVISDIAFSTNYWIGDNLDGVFLNDCYRNQLKMDYPELKEDREEQEAMIQSIVSDFKESMKPDLSLAESKKSPKS